jgi:hypothetical protein
MYFDRVDATISATGGAVSCIKDARLIKMILLVSNFNEAGALIFINILIGYSLFNW